MKKKLIYPFLALSFSFLFGACSGQTVPTEDKTHDLSMEHTTDIRESEAKEVNSTRTTLWSYDGETGPEHWGELDPSYSACGKGIEQSPINIETSQVKELKKSDGIGIQIQYKPSAFSLVNTGHTIQANATTKRNRMMIEGNEYKLTQFHFHTPSEHQLNGQHDEMELHLVHQDENGKLAVLGVMIQEGEENETLALIWDVLPKKGTETAVRVKELNLKAMLPQDQTSFHYKGSLTTPPCTEGVEWFVLKEPIEMSKAQIQAFREIFPDNHRPVQPLNKREIIRNHISW